MCLAKRNDFSRFFAPIQHGVATEGGAELLAHHLQLLLESHPEWIALKTDVRNAFNGISRDHMLCRVLSDFPDISSHTIQMYSEINSPVLLQDQSTIILTSKEGVHQGDPLGPMLFSLGIQSLLCDVQSPISHSFSLLG